MDNVRMGCSYLALSVSHDLKCLTLHQVNFKCKSECFFFFFFSNCYCSEVCDFFFFFSKRYRYDLHANGGASSLSISD